MTERDNILLTKDTFKYYTIKGLFDRDLFEQNDNIINSNLFYTNSIRYFCCLIDTIKYYP